MDFAAMAVKLHYTKADFEALTEVERVLIMKNIESDNMVFYETIAAAVAVGVANANRKKGTRAKKLFKKRSLSIGNQNERAEQIERVRKAVLSGKLNGKLPKRQEKPSG